MEVLELRPLKNKRVVVFLIKKEENILTAEQKVILNDVIEKYDFKFATISLEGAELQGFKQTDLGLFLGDLMLTCYNVDIPEFAKGHLDSEMAEKRQEIKELEAEYDALTDKFSYKAESMKAWVDYLKGELSEKEASLQNDLKPQWIVKKLLDIIRYYEDSLYYEDTIYVLHFTPEKRVPNLTALLEELGVTVIVGTIKEKVLMPSQVVAGKMGKVVKS